jgi:AraC family transcriptional regulator, chitin signaling transcriptional activator
LCHPIKLLKYAKSLFSRLSKFLTYFFLLFSITAALKAQQIPEKGVPFLENFTPIQYNNQGKIWDIDSAPNGIIYMAADRGLLEYDGKRWKNFSGSDGFTRSVHVINDSLIYTGSDLDFGIWNRNRYLEFEYRSLYPFREDMIELNEEFWDIHLFGDNVLFVSEYNIYVYRDNNLTKISAVNRFTGSFMVDGSLYFSDEESGLSIFRDLSLNPVPGFSGDSNIEISGIYQHHDGMVLVTYDSGLFLYSSGNLTPIDSPLSRILKNANVFSFEQIDENYLAIGTVQRGLYISDMDGNIIHYINRNKGLTNNTILSLHHTSNGKLWMGLDYGVSSLDLKNNTTFFLDSRGDFGTGYTAQLIDDVFYLGTNKGLFRTSWESLNNDVDFYDFDLIPGSEGQVWTLNIIENELFVGHDRGLFILKDNTLQRIGFQQGYWTIISYEDYLLGGTYNGISIFEKRSGEWTFLKRMDLIRGSVNQLIREKDQTLWINIPNYGIIRSVLDDELKPVERKIFFTGSFEGNDPYIEKGDNGIQVFTDKHTYTFSEADSSFNKKNETGFLSRPVEMMPLIYRPVAIRDEIEFLPLYNGFALKFHGMNDIVESYNTELTFRQIEAYNNNQRSQIFPGNTIPHALNNLKVDVLIPNQRDVLYQYRLNDKEIWSEWSTESGIDLINLPFGKGELTVRAMIDGDIYDEATLRFRISHPWYLTWYAYAFYLILFLMAAYLVNLWQKLTLEKQEEKHLISKNLSLREQSERHRQNILRLKQEQLQEDYDLLKSKLRDKTIKLANKSKENQDKNRLIDRLKKKIEKIEQGSEVSKTRWNEIHNILESYSTEDDNTFEIQIDQLHQEFFNRLKNQFSQLSSNDLRLCAYIKLGFNSKEIAEFLNIQPSSVYINRSRLRKKLDLETEEDLHEFLNSV